MDKDQKDLDQKLIAKIKAATKLVDTVGKDKKGFSGFYADGLEIRKEVNKALSESKLYVNAPKWYINPLTHETATYTKDGKEFIIHGTILLSIYDEETGHHIDYPVPGIGKGTDPMQAKGSAETYSIRQWLKEVFSVEVERDEIDVSTDKFVYDKTSVPVKALSADQINEVVKIIFSKTNDASTVKTCSAQILSKYNSVNKTNYAMLKDFPVSELEDIKKFAMAFEPDA